MRSRAFAIVLVCVLGFAGGFCFDHWLHRPITIAPGDRSAYHMERIWGL